MNKDKGEPFSKDYYENGVEKRLSGYTNYKYMPTRSYEEASTLKERWNDGAILDYGAAKGYLVHALNQLGFKAEGYDISEYAREHSHPGITIHSELPTKHYDYIVCKDVMEHVPEEEVSGVLKDISVITGKEALFVIPLGDDDKFRVREYEVDITHVTKKDEDWWINKLKEAGFVINDFKYRYGDIKKKWQSYEYGNGFFFVSAK